MTVKNELTNYYETLLSVELPKRLKRREKITMENFEEMLEILTFNTQNLLDYDFNIQQLKRLNKKFNLKISGNKTELLKRVYNYNRYSYQVKKIQKVWRNYIRKYFNSLRGPALIYRDLCVNASDFLSLENCKDIEYNNFFSYKDLEGKIWGFDLISIYNLFVKKSIRAVNPYTTKEFPQEVFENIKKIIKFNKVFKVSVELTLNQSDSLVNKQILEMRVLSLFQEMDSLDNYTQIEWLLGLNKRLLLKFIMELYDIWTYRANLSQNSKREICPPLGAPFRNINFNILSTLSQNQILKLILPSLEQLVKTGINRDARVLGTYYILSALTLVNNSAAEAMPWLYQSVLGN